jgi:hypothetical protein
MQNKDKKIITNDLYNDPIKYGVYEPGLVMLEDFIEQLEYDIQYSSSCLDQVKAHYKKFAEAFEEIKQNGKHNESLIRNHKKHIIIKELYEFFEEILPPKIVFERPIVKTDEHPDDAESQ